MNESFLYRVAHTYWTEKQEAVSDYTFVFPNRRAGLFFRKYLSEIAGKTIFSPVILTINQFFQELSSLELADNIDLLFRLFTVYQKHQHTQETFDDFVFWGRMMLSDFNEVDQHLVDAKALYANLKDLKALEEHFSHWSEDEELSVNAFIEHIHDGNTSQFKQQFFTIWNSLLPIYTSLQEDLDKDQLAYMGRLQREVVSGGHLAEKMAKLETAGVVFIGFNALTGVEKELMKQLRDLQMADFYWDYEAAWLRDKQNRASLFYEENKRLFPSTYSIEEQACERPQIHLMKIASAVGQAEVVRNILQELPNTNNWTKVGVVLPDEKMILPIQYAIPASIEHINITMGQPLKQTPIYSWLVNCSELSILSIKQDKGLYYKPLLSLLHHPYCQAVAKEEANDLQGKILAGNWVYVSEEQLADYPTLHQLIRITHSPTDTLLYIRASILYFAQQETCSKIDKEYLYQVLLIVNRVERQLALHPEIQMEVKTLYQLLLQLVETASVPFEGEPLLGLQIMGVLESRSMDFETLIVTDVNDEVLPGRVQPNTYIPYDLRLYFGLPTTERQDAIFAYNFYRLISHAKQVYLIQDTSTSDLKSGEVSRFVYQLQYQYNVPIDTHEIRFSAKTTQRSNEPISVEKDAEVMAQIDYMLTQRGISPSALNTYVSCPLRFYYQVILQQREPDVVSEEIQANQLGTVLHNTMERLYGNSEPTDVPYMVGEADVERLLKKVKELPIVEEEYRKEFYKDSATPLSGRDELAVFVIKRYVLNILKHDKSQTPFVYHASEKRLMATLPTTNGKRVKIKGFIDRIDSKGEQIRVIDYKTSKDKPLNAKLDIKDVFDPVLAAKEDYFRQTLFYGLLYEENYKVDCCSAIYYVRKQPKDIAIPQYESFQAKAAFRESLRNVLDEIWNESVPFTATTKEENCGFCPLTLMCGRKKKGF